MKVIESNDAGVTVELTSGRRVSILDGAYLEGGPDAIRVSFSIKEPSDFLRFETMNSRTLDIWSQNASDL